MNHIIGIRREDKNIYERRVPLIPKHIKELKDKHSIEFIVQPSKIRVFSDKEYIKAGAKLTEDLSQAKIIIAVKEIPIDFFEKNKTYIFFSHTIKGQKYSMPMLQKILNLNCTLIDYEKIVNEKGFRLIFFGRYAGYAGMIDTLNALGKRLNWEGIINPFLEILQTYNYKSLTGAKESVLNVGKKLEKEGLLESLVPFICGFAGYGNVSKGAQEILDLLPVKEIAVEELQSFYEKGDFSKNHIYKVVFKEIDMVEPILKNTKFELQDYYDNPEKYRSKFQNYVPYLTILMNCIYWDKQYPRLITKEYIKKLFEGQKQNLRIVGDISCDIEGAIEFTLKSTDSGNPVFVYNPIDMKITDGYKRDGIVVMAVDNLPCELPLEASSDFSHVLEEFIPEIEKAGFTVDFKDLQLSKPIKNAVITYQGKLTPNYKYLEKFLED